MAKGFMYDEMKQKELKETIENLTEQIKNDNSNPELYYKRALEYYQLSQQYYDILEIFDDVGDEDLYFEYVERAYYDIDVALSFDKEINDYAYSFKLLMLKKLADWENVVKYGLELYNGRGCTHLDLALIGEAYYNLEDWKNCIDFYTMVLDNVDEKTANNIGVKIFIQRGTAYGMIDKQELALKDYLKYVELNEVTIFDCYVYNLIAYAYIDFGKYEDAIKYYSKRIEIDPEHAESYFDRGKVYLDKLNKYSLAASDFDKAIEFAELEDYFYYHNCGYAYVHKGQIDENNGDYELALQDYNRAIEVYQKAIPLDPTGHDGSSTVGYAEDLKNELTAKMNNKVIQDNKNKDYDCQIPANIYYILNPSDIPDETRTEMLAFIKQNTFTANLEFNEDYMNNGGFLKMDLIETCNNINLNFALFTIINAFFCKLMLNKALEHNPNILMYYENQFDKIDHYLSNFEELIKKEKLNSKPFNNKKIVFCVENKNFATYTINYKNYFLGGMFTPNIMEKTFECIFILLKFYHETYVNYYKSKDFYDLLSLSFKNIRVMNIDTNILLLKALPVCQAYFMTKHMEFIESSK